MEKLGIRDLFDDEQIELIVEALNDKLGKHRGAIKRCDSMTISRLESIERNEDAIEATEEVLSILVENSI